MICKCVGSESQIYCIHSKMKCIVQKKQICTDANLNISEYCALAWQTCKAYLCSLRQASTIRPFGGTLKPSSKLQFRKICINLVSRNTNFADILYSTRIVKNFSGNTVLCNVAHKKFENPATGWGCCMQFCEYLPSRKCIYAKLYKKSIRILRIYWV